MSKTEQPSVARGGVDDDDDKGVSSLNEIWTRENEAKVSTESCKSVAAIRAVDSEDPSVDFNEPLAAYLAGDDWVDRVRAQSVANGSFNSGLLDSVSFRCQLVDEAIMNACHAGVAQVVVLGAGMDTRPFRLDLPPNNTVHWFEVDVPEMSNYKKTKLESLPDDDMKQQHATLKVRSHHMLSIDLATFLHELVGELKAAGFDPNAPVLYVAEGLVYYLTVDENVRMLDALVPAPPRSQVVATCVSPGLVAAVHDLGATIPAAKSIAASWKTNSEEYKDMVVKKSRGWQLDLEVNMIQEATHRNVALKKGFGGSATTNSENVLFLNVI